jgi:hypothetical protein
VDDSASAVENSYDMPFHCGKHSWGRKYSQIYGGFHHLDHDTEKFPLLIFVMLLVAKGPAHAPGEPHLSTGYPQ